MKIEDFKNYNFSILGTNTKLLGELEIEGDCIINAQITGNLKSNDQSKIIIERSANIEGDIYCHNLEIYGNVIGSINSSGTVIVRSCANVSGIIKSANLTIYPGAQVNTQIDTMDL